MTMPNVRKETTEKESQTMHINEIAVNNNSNYLLIKRCIDVFGAAAGLILLSPLFAVVYLLIKIEGRGGPVFFKQRRVGKDGEFFYMYKFRSMVLNAEALKVTLVHKNEASGPVFKIKHDPRVTKVGKFIRKTSIDELPQLVNVLKGEMSLVGPRPALPDEVKQYTLFERQRLSVTPGLTCFWQVSGRSNIGFHEWVTLDLKYINERSTKIDLWLILKTVLVLFGSRDAY
ncbi:sugar transferase [Planococcus shenhongbingii]|uniref:sugar transferase n=1 Tax=Planococcus shenhongbingii TaxID=3058398 RepID=UPI003F7109D1